MGAALVLLLVGLGALAAGVLIGRYYVPDDRQLRRTARHSRAYMRALGHVLARDHDTAVSELRSVVEENVEDVEPYFALGTMFRSRGEHERAIRVHQALAVRERDRRKLRQRAMYELGLDFRAAGMPRRATRAMEEALLEEPSHEGALRALAALYEEQARFNEAAELWQRLGRRRGENTSHREHHLLVAAAQSALGRDDLDSAKQLLKAAQKLEESAHFFAAAAELAAARGNHRAAKERLKQALLADPGLAPHVLPGLIAAEQGLAAHDEGGRGRDTDDLDEAGAYVSQLEAAEVPQLTSRSTLRLPAITTAANPRWATDTGPAAGGGSGPASTTGAGPTAGPASTTGAGPAAGPASTTGAGPAAASGPASTTGAGPAAGSGPASDAAAAPAAGATSSAASEVSSPASEASIPSSAVSNASSVISNLASAVSNPANAVSNAASETSNAARAVASDASARSSASDEGREAAPSLVAAPGSSVPERTNRTVEIPALVDTPRPFGVARVTASSSQRRPPTAETASITREMPSLVAEGVLALLDEIEAQAGPRLEIALIRAELVPPADIAARVALLNDLVARFPAALAARVAAARLALANGDPRTIRDALGALVSDSGAIAWALRGRWQCTHCGHRPGPFSWRCGQCRRWDTLRMETGVEPPPAAPRERRAAPRAVRPEGLLGTTPDEALPSASLDPGLSDAELASGGTRRSLLGKVGGWVSGIWRRGAS